MRERERERQRKKDRERGNRRTGMEEYSSTSEHLAAAGAAAAEAA